jgi:hypothetical protein
MRPAKSLAQAWIALNTDDPAAVSALATARERLEAGAALAGLTRWRLVELRGTLPPPDALQDTLHRSTQFYNPYKERAVLRTGASERAPCGGAVAVLVTERGGGRRRAAERWWKHETGRAVEVREGVVWALTFDPALEPDGERARLARAKSLAVLSDRAHGLFCNPHAQDWAAAIDPPLPWMFAPPRRPRRSAHPTPGGQPA